MIISRSGYYGFNVEISNSDLNGMFNSGKMDDMTIPFKKIQNMMHAMINSHFENEQNPVGKWTALKPNTLELKSLGIARIGSKRDKSGFEENKYGLKAMMGSGKYYSSLRKFGSSLHRFEPTGINKFISIGSDLPQVSNEWGKINASRYFRGAYVAQRSVLWFDEEFVDNAVEILLEYFNS